MGASPLLWDAFATSCAVAMKTSTQVERRKQYASDKNFGSLGRDSLPTPLSSAVGFLLLPLAEAVEAVTILAGVDRFFPLLLEGNLSAC